jgi:hypothetical protein
MAMEYDAEDAQEQEQLPPEEDEGQETSGQEAPPPPQPSEPSQREKELERRLTQQGRELAETRRTLTTTVQRLESSVASLTSNLSARDQRDADDRETQREAYLQTLPADQRALKKVELLEAELKSLRQGRTAAQAARNATPPRDDQDLAEMRRIAQGIVQRAQTRYGVTLTQADFDGFPESAWEDEHSFHDAVYDIADKKAQASARAQEQEGEADVAGKNGKTREEPEDADARTRRIVRQEMGVGSPAAPRAAAPKGKRPTEEDVRQAASTYNSAEGPKGNIKKLKELRSRMG